MSTPSSRRPAATDRSRQARLVVVRGNPVGRRAAVDGPVVIGRSHDAQLHIDDGEISRRHARVFYEPESGFVVEDLGSRNGTHVRGKAVERAALSIGEEFALGSHVVVRLVARDVAEDQAFEQQRMLAVGRLAAGVAHDVGNMMGAVASNVDWLRALPPAASLADPEVRESLADVLLAATRAAELMRSITGFARGHGRGRELVDLAALTTEVLRLLRHALGPTIEVESNMEPEVVVLGDRTELHQVVMNLCLNARDAMPTGGRLTVDVTLLAATGSSAAPDSGALEALLAVRDTGVGMSGELQARIFEPFFSTKGEGLGFGLGLATVREIVATHGGKIRVETTEGAGSTFRVLLPARLGRPRETWAAATIDGTRGSELAQGTVGATILLVDDEAVVQRSLARLLRAARFEVVLASSGPEALERYVSAARRPDLVLLDLDMPGWSGEVTLEALTQRDPFVRIVVMSGDPGRATRVQGTVGALEKPCDARTLLDAVRKGLVSEPPHDHTRPH